MKYPTFMGETILGDNSVRDGYRTPIGEVIRGRFFEVEEVEEGEEGSSV